MKTLKPGDRVKCNTLGLDTFPARKKMHGTILKSFGNPDLVKVKWDNLATTEKLSRDFLTRASWPVFS